MKNNENEQMEPDVYEETFSNKMNRLKKKVDYFIWG